MMEPDESQRARDKSVPPGPCGADGAASTTLSVEEAAAPASAARALGLARTVTIEGEAEASDAAPGSLALPPRYRDQGCIACGGFGEVRRVHDTHVDRVVAMKLLRAEVAAGERTQARFLAEAKLMAGLEHPGIVAVHDWGRLEDGRLWFTMREVRGRTLGDIIHEVHAAAGPEGFRETASGWTFRRLVDTFARACQAVAYAHRRGIIHRDLKPDNIMVGELGEALVMDWGLGLRLGDPDAGDAGEPPSAEQGAARLTRHGDVLGTPAYMPPEQARGARELHGLHSDVYSLGAILYHLLAARPPYQGGGALHVLAQVLAGPPAPVGEAAASKKVPDELGAICDRAMRWEIRERHADAEALAREVLAWLDGARRREQALSVVQRARAMEPEIAELREREGELRARAQALLDGVRPFDPIERKRPAWALEDEAHRLSVQAAVREAEWNETMLGALTIDPDLHEAHEALAEHSCGQLLEAERMGRDADAARFEARLRAHDRGRYAALLRGEGAVTVVTDPPGAEVLIERYELEDRRLVPRAIGILGTTPLLKVPLQRGSYRLRLRAPGHAEVLYPVLVERGGHWDGRAPGESEPYPIVLPGEGELGPDDVYVPAGWCWTGGDPEAIDGLPAQRVWIEAFVIRRFPVTSTEYIQFLNDLVARGEEAEALAACPRWHMGTPESTRGQTIYERDAAALFVPSQDREVGRAWAPDWPVVLIDWFSARAYSDWLARRNGHGWRLPNELEREKAARGVDARLCPWGNHLEATFACTAESQQRVAYRAGVAEHPFDESPYGVRGLAGNTRDWCGHTWHREGPELRSGRLVIDEARPEDPGFRSVKGGAWNSPTGASRSAARFASPPDQWWSTTGVRVVRSWRTR